MEEVHWALDARDKFRAAHPEEDIEPLPQIMTVLYPNPGFPLNLSNARKKLKEAQCKARQQPQPQIDAPGLQNTGPEQSEEPKQQGGQHRTTKLKHADSNDIRTASVAQQADFLQQEGEAGGTINTWELDPLRDGLRRLLQLTQTSPSCGRSADERVALSASNLSALAGSCLHRPNSVARSVIVVTCFSRRALQSFVKPKSRNGIVFVSRHWQSSDLSTLPLQRR